MLGAIIWAFEYNSLHSGYSQGKSHTVTRILNCGSDSKNTLTAQVRVQHESHDSVHSHPILHIQEVDILYTPICP